VKVETAAARERLTFAQAEGLAPLPTQLARGQISMEFRAAVWAYLFKIFEAHRDHDRFSGMSTLESPWRQIFKDAHVYHYHLPVDEYRDSFRDVVQWIK